MAVSSGCGRKAASEGAAPPAAPPAAAQALPAATSAIAPKLCPHRVPADLCTQCNPELADVYKDSGDWCEKHGVPESLCLQCHPDLDFSHPAATAAKEPYCKEHGVPEAMCTKCNPKLVVKFVESGNYCREHGLPESVCPFCHPEVALAAGMEPPAFPPPGLQVKLARPELARMAGIETEVATAGVSAESAEVVGQLEFDPNRLARLSARGDSLVERVLVDSGDAVAKGQRLVVLKAASVGESQGKLSAAKARLEAARAQLSREEALLERRISSQRDVEQARSEVAAAQGEQDAALASLRAAGAEDGSGGRYVLASPMKGVVVSRSVAPGQTATSGEVLLEVADVSALWASLDVPEELAARVRPGQAVVLHFDKGAHPDIRANVTRVLPSVDKQTRTVRVRVDVPNATGALKAGLFLRARIELQAPTEGVVLPEEAVQRAEGHDLVFVKTAEMVYEPRAVGVRRLSGRRVAVLSGLQPGAHVVTTGAFLLKTEIMKESIGAGCADDH